MQVKPDNPRRDQFILCTVHAAKVRDEYFFRSGKKPCAYLGVCKLNPFGLWFLCNGKCEYYKPWAPSRKSCYHCKANIVCKDYEALPEEIDGKADTCAYYDPT
jgi:hypothetical protein